MRMPPFATEHFFARYEFNTPYQLCNSDCETLTITELLNLANVPLSSLGELGLGYTESQGDPQLRTAIVTAYRQVSPDAVVMLATPVEGIYLAAQTLLESDDEVIVLTPAYDALINVFEALVGPAQVKKWTFRATTTTWQLDLHDLQRLISPRTKLVVVNFPHNPTGYLPTPAQLQELITLVEAHGLWLFYDEMYFGLVHSDTPSIPSAADLSRRAVVLSGLSKTYGLPGLRTGWLIVHDAALRAEIMNWKFYTSICPPAPSEFLAGVAWQVREALRQRSLQQIEHNLTLAEAFFQRWPDLFVWRRPRAGSTALVQMNIPSVTSLAHTLAAEAGILIHPAHTLGSDDQHLRFGFGRASFGEALEKFEAYLQNRL